MSEDKTKVLVLLGSLRAGSLNRQLAEVAVENPPSGVEVSLYEGLGDVPLYNEDIDTADAPAAAVALRAAGGNADAVLVVTPEHNGTIPAALKNAIDWLSRPYGSGALKGKPVAVIGSSLSSYGGKWAHDDARKSFGIAGAAVVESSEFSVSSKVFDGKHPRENAEVTAKVREVLEKLIADVSR